ncbi:MAG: hypothetical protein ABJG15_17510 [Hyphomonadaceae bacterium]
MINTFAILTGLVPFIGPIDAALDAADTPLTIRAAFDVELKSDTGIRVFSYDPRLPTDQAWRLKFAEGEDGYLDELAAHWGAEAAPDGRLLPDDLRASLGSDVKVDVLGDAWRLGFEHVPSANDEALDLWVGARVDATAWLSPELGQFLRIDYHLPKPVRGPEGGRILTYEQSYFLEPDPVYNLSMITAFSLSFSARGGFKTIRQSYSMRVLKLEVFFATPEDEADFLEARALKDIGVASETP